MDAAVAEPQHRSSPNARPAPIELGSPPCWRTWAGEHLLAIGICVALLAWLYDFAHFDWNAPQRYRNDALFYLLMAKGLFEHGWYLVNPDVGFPFGLEMHDFPLGDTLHFLLMKPLAMVLPSSPAVLNVYFFLTYPLTAVITLGVLRHFRVSYWPALVSSILFAFLPYHQLRGVGHFFLSCYYLVPLGIMVVLWMWQGEALLLRRDPAGKLRFVFHKKTAASLVILTLLGLSNIYYIYFTGFLMVITCIARSLRSRGYTPALEGMLLIALLGASSVVNVLPNLLYIYTEGRNPAAVHRQPDERGGLRIAQLLTSVTHHRIHAVARAKERFNGRLYKVGNSDWAALGCLGSIGFLALIARLLYPPRADDWLWVPLSRLNLFSVLLATIGGFGLLVALGFRYIRGYERMCVIIGFFALFALALLLDRVTPWFRARPVRGLVAVAALIVLGVLDQSPFNMVPRKGFPDHGESAEQYYLDAQFVRAIEAQVPTGAAIYQLPYHAFPEEPQGYESVRMYLHATHTRWSYPTMRGRAGDRWHRELAPLPVPELLPRVAEAGFSGVCLNRKLLTPDRAAALERELTETLAVSPLVCPQGQFVFFPLQGSPQIARSARVSDPADTPDR